MRTIGGMLRSLRVPVAGAPVGDVIVAAVFVLTAEIEVMIRVPSPSWRQSVSMVASLALLSLAWRRRWPLLAPALIAAIRITQLLTGTTTDVGTPIVALFVASYSLGAHAGNRDLAIGALLPLVAVVAGQALLSRYSLASALPFFALFIVGAPIIAGRAVRSRGQLVRELQQQQAALRAEREARAAEALAIERVQMLRDLHDIVSAGIEKLVAEVEIAESHPRGRGRDSITQVEATARTVLNEMRRLLIVLGQPNGRASPLTDARVAGAGPVVRERWTVEDPPAAEPASNRSWAREVVGRWPAAAAMALFLGVELELQFAQHSTASRALYLLGGLAVAAPLAWLRRRPLLAAAGSSAAAALVSTFVVPLGGLTAPLALILVPPFAIAAVTDRRRAVLGLIVCDLGLAAGLGISNFAAASLFAAGAFAAGRLLRDHNRLANELRSTNRRLARERDSRARQLVVAERARVARELHDVIGHSLTVIVLQAGAARRMWDLDPEQAVTALKTVSRVAREGLTELLRSLESLDGDQDQPLRYQSLATPEGLIGRARRAGLDVEIAVQGSEVALDSGLERAAYRVLQEALTNVLKHAPGSKATVMLRYSDRQLELEVVNFLVSSPTRTKDSSGRGLVGMQERVVAHGGHLEAGEQPNRKFELRVHFPLPRASP